MNKKSVDKVTNTQQYNQLLFAEAQGIASCCRDIANQAHTYAKNSAIGNKQIALENALKNTIGIFGKFVQIQKSTMGSTVDYGLEVFEAVTDLIETSAKKYRDFHKNNKGEKKTQGMKQKVNKRPQQMYGIKPVNFDFHNHQKNLQFIRTDTSIEPSRNLQQPYVYVSNPHELEAMISELLVESEIAVDVQHSSKSYEGFTCLIQISTRKKDYIVDVFPLWQHIHLLKQVIENDMIVKVMHGAEMDTRWLQRDFNIHIFNLFDTYKASRLLGFPKLSYAFLLNHYCSTLTDKTYQLADWRIRPLTNEMLHYARLDTHFLLQIFDRLRADLHQKALSMNMVPEEVIRDVYASSFEVTKNEVELFNFRNKDFYINLKKQAKDKEIQIFDRVFDLLDQTAKRCDISFDEIVTRKVQNQIISKLRELLYDRNGVNVRSKIDKLVSLLRQSHSEEVLKDVLPVIKQELQNYFQEAIDAKSNQNKQINKSKQSIKLEVGKIGHFEQEIQDNVNKKVEKHQYKVLLTEYPIKSYENPFMNPFTMLIFEPIACFLSMRAGVDKKQAKQQDNEMESQIYMQESQSQSAEPQENKQGDEEGVIEFKRVNPNVIYAIEEVVEVQQKHKPRKKRKEYQYQEKLKNKSGNIYDLLED